MTSSRNGRPYRTLRERLRQAHALAGSPCHLCGKPINYSLKWPHRMSFSLDHIVPVWAGGSDKDPHNFGSSHLSCNAARGAREGNRLRGARRAAQRFDAAEQQPTSSRWDSEVPQHTSWRW